MRYCVDIDGTICTPTVGRAYEKAEPWNDRLSTINKLPITNPINLLLKNKPKE